MTKKKISVAVLLIVAFVSGVLFTTAGANIFGIGDHVGNQLEAAAPVSTVSPDLDVSRAPALNPVPVLEFEDLFISVAEQINPMVVQIHSERVVKRSTNSFFPDTPFEQFFRFPDRNNNGSDAQRTQALGSGVIIRENGFIVTNNHVIADADDLIVTLDSGEEYDAEVVGTDPASDLAVIRITARDLPSISMPETANVRVGQWVLAFGSPLSEELGNTVTTGIVSAVRRTSNTLSGLNLIASFIQTDAAINPGNSGGPLVNLRGELVGINSAIYSRSGGSQGVGFSIPVDVVRNVVDQLIENGEVERGFLGVNFNGVSRSYAEAVGVPLGSAQITNVLQDTPADDAGLEEGDVIVAIDGTRLKNFNEIRTMIGNLLPGDEVSLDVVRDGNHREISVRLGSAADSPALAQNRAAPRTENDETPSSVSDLGFSIQPLNDRMAQQLGLSDLNIHGVLVQSIDVSSDAYRDAELRRGDIITELDGKPVGTESDFKRAYDGVEKGESFIVEGYRAQTQRKFFTALTKPE